MPHARHGGIGVFSFEVEGSKLDGTGLENEHIGQIQVAFGDIRGAGLLLPVDGVSVPLPPAVDGRPMSKLAVLCAREKCFAAFG